MAVRITVGGYEYLDPIAGQSSAGGGETIEDGTRNPPWVNRPGYGQNDLVASEALRLAAIPREELWRQRPPVPAFGLFPPKFGYDTTPYTIEDIVYGDWRPRFRTWVPAGRDGAMADMSGTLRNVNPTSNPML